MFGLGCGAELFNKHICIISLSRVLRNGDFDNDFCGGSLNYFCYYVLFHRMLKLELENTNSLLQRKPWSRQLLNLVAHCLAGGPTKISNSFSGQTY